MAWYWIVLMVAALAGLVGLLYVLKKKEVISHDMLSAARAVVQFVRSKLEKLFCKEQSTATQVMVYVVRLVEAAVLMAEHLWYDGEIDFDQRYEKAKELLVAMLKDAGVVMPDEIDGMIDVMIEASQKIAGHESYDEYAVALVMECQVDEVEVEDDEVEVEDEASAVEAEAE